jgi:hypothetical protein
MLHRDAYLTPASLEEAFDRWRRGVTNAIYDAAGVRVTSLPAPPEKVLQAIKQKERARREVAAE